MNNPGGLQVPQFPAANSQQRISPNVPAGNGDKVKTRAKVGLTPGHSLMDWVRIANQKGRVLNGVDGNIITVTEEELVKHNTVEDAWTCIRGMVYNLTPYMDFHPGGVDELMRAAGKDGTQLFDEFHQWVNIESLMDKCLVGKLRKSSTISARLKDKKPASSTFLLPPQTVPQYKSKKSSSSTLLAPPQTRPQIKKPVSPTFATPSSSSTTIDGKSPSPVFPVYEGPPKARYDWFQKDDAVFITVYAKCKKIDRVHVITDLSDNRFRGTLYLDDHVYTICLDLSADVQGEVQVRVRDGPVNRVDFTIRKCRPEKWEKLGEPREGDNQLEPANVREMIFRTCKLCDIAEVTHDSKLMTFELPPGTTMYVPIGYHVYLQREISGAIVNRPYTVVVRSFNRDDHKVKEFPAGRYLHLMIKMYEDGLLTPHLATLKIGDSINISDFEGSFDKSQLTRCSDLILLAAGTGLTPMLRLIHHTTTGNLLKSSVKLLFFNKTEGDILWRDELEKQEKQYKSFKFINILSEADGSWLWLRGRVSETLLKQQLAEVRPTETPKCLICVCGPTGFTQATLKILKNLGYQGEMIHLFTS